MDTFAPTKGDSIITITKIKTGLCVELQFQWKHTAAAAQTLPFSSGVFFLFVTIVDRVILAAVELCCVSGG